MEGAHFQTQRKPCLVIEEAAAQTPGSQAKEGNLKCIQDIYGPDPLGTFKPHGSCRVGIIIAISPMRKPGLVKLSLSRAT